MSLLALASAKGSPGVSTAAFALAVCWPAERALLLAEADPAGSALAPRFDLPYERGVISLAPASRHRFDPDTVDAHLQHLAAGAGRAGVDVLVGVRSVEQSPALGRFWAEFSKAMATDSGRDVIFDCGRLQPDSPAMAAVGQAQLTLLFTRSDVESVLQTALRLAALREAGMASASVGVVVIGKGPHRPGDVAEATGAGVVGTLPHDPRAAAVLSGASTHQHALTRSGLLRAVQTLCGQILHRLPPGGVAVPPPPPAAERVEVGPPGGVAWSEQGG